MVGGLAGGATEVRRLNQLETEVRDLIAGLTDSSEAAFELDWNYDLPPELARPVRQFVEARTRRQAAEHDYATAQERAVDALASRPRIGAGCRRTARPVLPAGRPNPPTARHRRPPTEDPSASAGQLNHLHRVRALCEGKPVADHERVWG